MCAAGDVSAEGTSYLIAGAIAIAIVGSALPILFSRKDLYVVSFNISCHVVPDVVVGNVL